ncbi:MAG: hypothetical protein IV090_11750 [Candidatus Sericytochromatia bacterium]|nr:hypothetical protein [Candidatus Sericytochromatia bacterium]
MEEYKAPLADADLAAGDELTLEDIARMHDSVDLPSSNASLFGSSFEEEQVSTLDSTLELSNDLQDDSPNDLDLAIEHQRIQIPPFGNSPGSMQHSAQGAFGSASQSTVAENPVEASHGNESLAPQNSPSNSSAPSSASPSNFPSNSPDGTAALNTPQSGGALSGAEGQLLVKMGNETYDLSKKDDIAWLEQQFQDLFGQCLYPYLQRMSRIWNSEEEVGAMYQKLESLSRERGPVEEIMAVAQQVNVYREMTEKEKLNSDEILSALTKLETLQNVLKRYQNLFEGLI